MSKNVAVFVDVANIFYAAKAAGVDIDYVTLLKSATAGRDFVRAYAYTGLDPENENQRQFHNFLTRSGYKVVSKDIRKYGDGRIKANLDIELVVDLMRLAQHIDIAVVVSGDGDFAPAIRAVQQLGVRVEVISFRGNTSSDLIEVSDVFTDISQIARVEKGARSGRRIAAEDDLSMTVVPQKETDLGPRRRRGGRRGERDERVATRVAPVEVAAAPSNLIVLPGERLSRQPAADEAPDGEILEPGAEEPEVVGDGAEAGDGRRRRRRRGGRGRGRGHRPEGEVVAEGTEGVGADEEEEFLEEELAPLPQHSAFGSVWDTQIGLPAAPVSAGETDEDEDYEDEPEIPEYLLAERRQQGQRGGRGRDRRQRGGRAGYQSAIDRERYGRAGGSMYAGGGQRPPDRGRQQGGPRPAQAGGGAPRRAPRPAQPDVPRVPERSSGSAEPWSEVPPEVQELLRAELARRQAGSRSPAAATRPVDGAAVAGTAPVPTGGRTRRRRPASPAGVPGGAQVPAVDAGAAPAGIEPAATATVQPATEAPETVAPAKPTTRRRTSKATGAPAPAASPAPAPVEPLTETARPPRRTRAKPSASTEAPAGSTDGVSAPVEKAQAKPTRRRAPRATDPATPEG